MRLFEFETVPGISAKLIAVTDQLKTDLENNKLNFGMTTDQLLDYFQEYDIILDVTDLYNMIQVPPLKQVITNIQGDKVVFKGQSDDSENPNQESEQEKTVAQMAKSAMK
jgi:FMN-dependent NADH-azoreductase